MKEIIINRVKFLDLVGERYFVLPQFQHNKKLFGVSKKRKLDQQKYFAGDIILKKGNEDNDFSEIIDGQQRLVTAFILLHVIYEKLKNPSIEKILFLENENQEKEIRISLNNKYDKQEFEKALGLLQVNKLMKKKGRKRKPGNILRAKGFFTKFLETETKYNLQEIYEVVTKNFYFALVEIPHNDKVQELFTALNNTGLNLSNSDLLKKKPTDEKRNIKPTKLSIYDLFESEVTDENKASEILSMLTNYAEVYKNIKDPDKKDSEEEKKLVMKELETTLYFIFRLITVKGKSPGDIPRFVPSIIEEIAVNKKLFNSDLKKDWLEKEFSDDGRKKFYDELLTYSTKRNKIWEFVLKTYYSRKFQNILKFESAESSTMDLKQFKCFNLAKLVAAQLEYDYQPENEHFCGKKRRYFISRGRWHADRGITEFFAEFAGREKFLEIANLAVDPELEKLCRPNKEAVQKFLEYYYNSEKDTEKLSENIFQVGSNKITDDLAQELQNIDNPYNPARIIYYCG
ncbi:10698_t:CDS:2 [Funneliformis geosporum]|uniref:10698_t:CDS:1 n=1 Tax=Funneliformis geosporum TaxID=1117311 RepID=A0A9W4WPK3_9GLOM|nr:10698_t:CDS:2 [Funneliformis geosporum]